MKVVAACELGPGWWLNSARSRRAWLAQGGGQGLGNSWSSAGMSLPDCFFPLSLPAGNAHAALCIGCADVSDHVLSEWLQ